MVARARVIQTHAKKRRRQSLAGRRVRVRVDLSVSLHARARPRVCVCVYVDARRGRTHVKCPSYFEGLRWRRRRRCRCCRRRLTIGDSPGSAAASFPRRRAHHHHHRTPLRAYKSLPTTLHRRHRRQRRHRRNLARTPLVDRRREVRARSVYYSKLLSATTGRAPPPAVGVAAASRTRTKRSIGQTGERTRVHSTEWNAVDAEPRLPVARASSSSSSSYSVTVRARHVTFVRREITR
jgi:hypothetical protein